MLQSQELSQLKIAASGRWSSIVSTVANVSPQYLTTTHGPCPKCGGRDRWRVFDDFEQTGGAICNQCGSMGDGFALIQNLRNCSFTQARKLVEEHLGFTGQPGKRAKGTPESNLQFHETFPEALAAIYHIRKPGVTAVGLKLCRARFANYRRVNEVFALPAAGKKGEAVGYAIVGATGKLLPVFSKDSATTKQPSEWVKTKTTSNSDHGWLGPLPAETDQVIWKVEGVSDLLSLLSLGLPEGHTAVSNLFGAGEDPASTNWMLERFRGKQAYVVHDCDIPGQEGAIEHINKATGRTRPGWAPAIANFASDVRNVVLPYAISENKGKDLRYWILDQKEKGLSNAAIYRDLLTIAESSQRIEPKTIAIKQNADEIDYSLFEKEHVDDPHRLARINIENYERSTGRTIRYWKESWYSWKAGVYVEMPSDHFVARLNLSIKAEFDRVWQKELKEHLEKKEDKPPPRARRVTKQLVSNVLEATKSMCMFTSTQKLHSWVDGRDEGRCIAVSNGILNLTKVMQYQQEGVPVPGTLQPHTPDWFSTIKLGFSYNPRAECPIWESFLNSAFPGDQAAIETLQMWFGYLLTNDTSLHKMLFVIGVPRSGKSTISHVMTHLFGESNICTPTLGELAESFCLQSFIGKSCAIIAEGRLSEKADASKITERLLSISGDDPQNIPRKYKDTLTAFKLSIRFTLFSNLMPTFRDASSAFLSRCIFLHMRHSFLGKEDFGLKQKLLTELSGILNWAVRGRKLLDERGRIEQPEQGRDLIRQLEEIISPALAFLNENFVFDRTLSCSLEKAFEMYSRYCEKGKSNPGTLNHFSRKIQALKQDLEVRRMSLGATKRTYVFGMGISQEVDHELLTEQEEY